MGTQSMKTAPQLISAIAIAVVALGSPVRAAEPDVDRFRSEIDAFVGRLGPSTNGAVTWVGSDPFEIQREGDTLLAVIANARLSFHIQQVDQLTLDRVEIRRTGQKEGCKLIE